MKAKHVLTSGEEVEVAPKNGKTFSLAELQELVGGFIEVISIGKGQLMVLNEEGKLEGLEPNDRAIDYAANAGLSPFDVIVGNVVVMDSSLME